jgi:hypothetical protein
VSRLVAWWAAEVVLGRGPFPTLGRDYTGCDLRFVGLFISLLFLEKGVFPCCLVDPYGRPRQ